MARRYIGDATIEIEYQDDDTYSGVIRAGGRSWKFDELRAPRMGFPFAYDSPEAYDKMAGSAVSFGSYYTTMNRGDDTPDWAPEAEVADAIEEATAWDQDDQGEYSVRRSKNSGDNPGHGSAGVPTNVYQVRFSGGRYHVFDVRRPSVSMLATPSQSEAYEKAEMLNTGALLPADIPTVKRRKGDNPGHGNPHGAFKVGDKVSVTLEGLQWHARSVPAHMGYTREQMAWRKALSDRQDVAGTVTRVGATPGDTQNITVEYPDGYTAMIYAAMLKKAGNPDPFEEAFGMKFVVPTHPGPKRKTTKKKTTKKRKAKKVRPKRKAVARYGRRGRSVNPSEVDREQLRVLTDAVEWYDDYDRSEDEPGFEINPADDIYAEELEKMGLLRVWYDEDNDMLVSPTAAGMRMVRMWESIPIAKDWNDSQRALFLKVSDPDYEYRESDHEDLRDYLTQGLIFAADDGRDRWVSGEQVVLTNRGSAMVELLEKYTTPRERPRATTKEIREAARRLYVKKKAADLKKRAKKKATKRKTTKRKATKKKATPKKRVSIRSKLREK